MKKRILSIIFAICIVFQFSVTYATAQTNSEYAVSANAKIVNYSQGNVSKYEKMPKTRNVDNNIEPRVVDPGVGAYQLTTTSRWSSGVIYEDGFKSGTSITSIANETLSIAGIFTGTVKSIILYVAQKVLNWSESDIAMSRPGSAKLMHSYSYYSKLGQIYMSNRTWKTYVDIEKREWFKHELASFAGSDGYTRTYTLDCTRPNGYSPIYSDVLDSHFNDNTWICNRAIELYMNGSTPYVSAWTH